MKRVGLVVVVAALCVLPGPGPAQAQTTSVLQAVGVPDFSGKLVSQTTVLAHMQGELVVSFHGDPAAGCSSYGLCSYSGTIVVRPRNGALSVVTLRRGGRIRHLAVLDLESGSTGYVTSAREQRSVPDGPAATCADVGQPLLAGEIAGVTHGRSVTLRLLSQGGSLLQTRCAGPLDSDLSNAGPTSTVPLARLRRGDMTLAFHGSGTFASHGFVGTITSTLTVMLGKPHSSKPASTGSRSGSKVQGTRIVTEELSVVRVRGRVGATIRGTANPVVCELLDSCGVSGTLTLGARGRGRDDSAEVVAVGPARRPYRDFLTALGLSHRGRSRGISVGVLAGLTGRVDAAVIQAGSTCTDTASTGGVSFDFGLGSPGGSVFSGSWRTRCPGPILEGGSHGLVASFDRAALGHREFSLGLRATGSLQDDGYVIVPHGRLSMLLRRGRITQQVIAGPTG